MHFYKICNFHYCIACRLEWNWPSEWLTRLDTSRCFLLHFSSLYPSLHFRFCFLTIAIISKRWFQCFILKISFCFSLKVKASFFFMIGLSAYIKLVKVLLLTWALAFPLAMGSWRWLDAIAFLLIASNHAALISYAWSLKCPYHTNSWVIKV